MSERSFFTRLGQHISFVYNQIGLYPVQSTIIAFNIIFVVGGAIACRRCYVKSREDDVLVKQSKVRKRRKKYDRSEKSSSSDSSEQENTIVDIESDTDSEPFRQKQPRKNDTSSDSNDSSTSSSASDTAVMIDIDSSESSDESEDPLLTPKKLNKGRSPFTYRSQLELKKLSSCTQTEVKGKSGKKTIGTQTVHKRNSSTQTTSKSDNCDFNDDSNDSELSWYHNIQRFRKPNIVSPPILTSRYKKHSHIDGKDKHRYSHDPRDTKVYKKKGGKKTIFGVALKPVCNSDGDERQLMRNFDPNLTNFSVSPRVK